MTFFNGTAEAEARAQRTIAEAQRIRSMSSLGRWLTNFGHRRQRRESILAEARRCELIRNEVAAGLRHRPRFGCSLGCNPIENDCSWPYCGRSKEGAGDD